MLCALVLACGAVDPITVYCWKGGGWAGFSQKVWKAPNYLGHEVVKKECDGAHAVFFAPNVPLSPMRLHLRHELASIRGWGDHGGCFIRS